MRFVNLWLLSCARQTWGPGARVKLILWVLALIGLAGLTFLVWREGQGGPSRYLYAMPGPQEEAAYCLAVSERIREITRGTGREGMEWHIDEQIEFWRTRAGSALGPGRAALARDSNAPGVNEQAHLHLAVQDCALRAINFYGHRFPSMEEGGL